MLYQLFLFSIGLTALYFGAEWLVNGAVGLALRFGIRRMVVGLTVVALGTSMPEFLVNFFAAMRGADDLALGNIVGSNIANIALILGLSAMVFPLVVRPATIRKEYPIMMAATVVFYGMSYDGEINQVDGIVLVLGLVAFFVYLVLDARSDESKSQVKKEKTAYEAQVRGQRAFSVRRKVGLLLGGMIALAVGARFMVSAAIAMAEMLGINQVIVGLTVVAIGTSLPELAASMMCAFKEEPDLSVGNILGSNLMNILFVVGLVSLIRPLKVDAQVLTIHFPVMIGFGILLLPLAWSQYKVTRFEGSILVAGFVGYVFYLSFPYLS